MSQYDEDLDTEAEQEQPQKSGVRQRMKALEDENRRLREDNGKAQAAIRREAMRNAGLDLSNRQVSWAADRYDGDLTEEAIAAWGLDMGYLSPPEPTTPKAEQEAHQRMNSAQTASTPSQTQWSEADIKAAFKAKRFDEINAAYEAGLLNTAQGIDR